jgi:uncharacterized protein YjbJ (UPF0337 family)
LKPLKFAFIYYFQGTIMNKDQVTGKVKEIAGKVQAGAGKLMGNPQQEHKGERLQVEGKNQEIQGNAKAFVKDDLQAAKETLHTHR